MCILSKMGHGCILSPRKYLPLSCLWSEEGEYSPSLVCSGGGRVVLWCHNSKVEQTLLGRQETRVLVLALPVTHYDVGKSFPLSRWV